MNMNTVEYMKGSETEKIFEVSAYMWTSHFGRFLINSWGGSLIRGSYASTYGNNRADPNFCSLQKWSVYVTQK